MGLLREILGVQTIAYLGLKIGEPLLGGYLYYGLSHIACYIGLHISGNTHIGRPSSATESSTARTPARTDLSSSGSSTARRSARVACCSSNTSGSDHSYRDLAVNRGRAWPDERRRPHASEASTRAVI